jgi:hypothetical protein
MVNKPQHHDLNLWVTNTTDGSLGPLVGSQPTNSRYIQSIKVVEIFSYRQPEIYPFSEISLVKPTQIQPVGRSG